MKKINMPENQTLPYVIIGAFSSGVILFCTFLSVFVLAVSGIGTVMHKVQSNPVGIVAAFTIIAILCLAAFIFALIKYIRIYKTIRNIKMLFKDLLLYFILTVVFLLLPVWILF